MNLNFLNASKQCEKNSVSNELLLDEVFEMKPLDFLQGRVSLGTIVSDPLMSNEAWFNSRKMPIRHLRSSSDNSLESFCISLHTHQPPLHPSVHHHHHHKTNNHDRTLFKKLLPALFPCNHQQTRVFNSVSDQYLPPPPGKRNSLDPNTLNFLCYRSKSSALTFQQPLKKELFGSIHIELSPLPIKIFRLNFSTTSKKVRVVPCAACLNDCMMKPHFPNALVASLAWEAEEHVKNPITGVCYNLSSKPSLKESCQSNDAGN
ncbi:hypothetical protein TSUD_247660 [Trifolium subterraneum]|uniref:Uncharacterized protein n=1 Tax=Trifolium subterraneum TaxID=3900 RepID=A0A2Z6NCC9_TRISU|nr:hypothetical protein TSUD_247660 [Trifolium subterraneum]